MNKQWKVYCEKYLAVSLREQYMVLITGLVAIIFITHTFFIDENASNIVKLEKKVMKISKENLTAKASIILLKEALSKNPNAELNKQISQYKARLNKADVNLLKLTSDLISPIQMRYALMELLKTQKDVSLQSFQIVAAKPITLANAKPVAKVESGVTDVDPNKQEMVLYRHAIKIKLSGSYFQLRDYLIQLESLSWKFFWQEFNYQLKEYPVSELEIEMYSLSTKREFIGV